MSDSLVNHSTGGKISSSILVARVGSEEPHVVPLGAHDKGKGGSVLVTSNLGRSFLESLEFLTRSISPCLRERQRSLDHSLDDVGVLSLRDTIPEHDDLLWQLPSLVTESLEVVGSHSSQIGDDLPDTASERIGRARGIKALTFVPPGVGWKA